MYSDSDSIPGVPYTSNHYTELHHYWVQTQSVYTYRDHYVEVELLVANRNYVFRFKFNPWGTTLALITQITSVVVANSVFMHTRNITMFRFRFNYWVPHK